MPKPESDREPYWRVWFAVTDADEPIDCVGEYLAEANRELVVITERVKPHLTNQEIEFLSGLSVVMSTLDMALSGEKSDGRDTFYALEFRPRRRNRVKRRDRARKLGAAVRRYTELRSKGLPAREAEQIVISELEVNRTELKAHAARSAAFFASLERLGPKTGG